MTNPEPRGLPASVESEHALLGSVLLDQSVMDLVGQKLKPEHFFLERHQVIWKAAQAISARGQPPDLVLLANELQRLNQLDFVGGAAYLTSLANVTPTAVHAEHYAQVIRDCHTRRKMVNLGTEIVQKAYDAPNPDEAIAQSALDMLQLSPQESGGFIHLGTINRVGEQMLEALNDPKEIYGMTTGYGHMDRHLGGLEKGSLIIISARPSGGKTALLLGMTLRRGLKGEGTGIISLEMSAAQIKMRLLGMLSHIPTRYIKRGLVWEEDKGKWRKFTVDERDRLWRAYDRLDKLPIYIDDTASADEALVRSHIMHLKAQHEIDVFGLDYLNLTNTAGGNKRTKNDELDNFVRGMKNCAKELLIALFVLCQMNRDVDKREGHVPQMSDIRDSGAIEAHADIILMPFSEDYFASQESVTYTHTDDYNLMVRKNRLDGIGNQIIPFTFVREVADYEEAT